MVGYLRFVDARPRARAPRGHAGCGLMHRAHAVERPPRPRALPCWHGCCWLSAPASSLQMGRPRPRALPCWHAGCKPARPHQPLPCAQGHSAARALGKGAWPVRQPPRQPAQGNAALSLRSTVSPAAGVPAPATPGAARAGGGGALACVCGLVTRQQPCQHPPRPEPRARAGRCACTGLRSINQGSRRARARHARSRARAGGRAGASHSVALLANFDFAVDKSARPHSLITLLANCRLAVDM